MLPTGEAQKTRCAPSSGRVRPISEAVADLPDWPGMPAGTRALVTRSIGDTETHERLFTVGYLRIGVEGEPPNRIYDHLGKPTQETMQQGDFIDGYQDILRWIAEGATLQRAVPADGAAAAAESLTGGKAA